MNIVYNSYALYTFKKDTHRKHFEDFILANFIQIIAILIFYFFNSLKIPENFKINIFQYLLILKRLTNTNTSPFSIFHTKIFLFIKNIYKFFLL